MPSDKMEQINVEKEMSKLKPSDQYYIRKMQAENQKRVGHLVSHRRRARFIAGFCVAAVFGIYFYTLSAVKQEKFLDFEEKPDSAGTGNKSTV